MFRCFPNLLPHKTPCLSNLFGIDKNCLCPILWCRSTICHPIFPRYPPAPHSKKTYPQKIQSDFPTYLPKYFSLLSKVSWTQHCFYLFHKSMLKKSQLFLCIESKFHDSFCWLWLDSYQQMISLQLPFDWHFRQNHILS